jgi:hypothetical protein
MNVEIGAEAALFSEKEYICGIFVAVRVFLITYPLRKKYLHEVPALQQASALPK